ncbi:MAG: hypothetical protein AAF745_18240, partial [Planctomycetota bacterium]
MTLAAFACRYWLISATLVSTAAAQLSDSDSWSSLAANYQRELSLRIAIPTTPDRLQELLGRGDAIESRLQNRFDELNQQIIQQSDELQDANRRRRLANLKRQRAELALRRLEIIVMRSELFAAGSRDAVAIASRAVALSEIILATLPSDGIVRDEALRLVAEAELRRGQPERASAALAMRHQSPKPDAIKQVSSSLEASLRSRIASSMGDLEQAAHWISSAADEHPALAMADLELHLKRHGSNSTHVAEAVDCIERKFGELVGDQAKTRVAMARIRNGHHHRETATPSKSQDASSDVRLQRADAIYQLRIGNRRAAAVTFARAAASDHIAKRAIESAIKASAILATDTEHPNSRLAAAELLNAIGMKHRAPELVLQSASVLQAANAVQIEVSNRLMSVIEGWPESSSAETARDQWIDLAIRRDDLREAAVVASSVPSSAMDASTINRATQLWGQVCISDN